MKITSQTVKATLEKLGLAMPLAPTPAGSYLPTIIVEQMIIVSGMLPRRDGQLIYQGQVGRDVTLAQAQEAAQWALLNALTAIEQRLENFKRIRQFARMDVFVASATGFYEQHLVANAASDLAVELFGDRGRHTRTAVGVTSLPLNACVEVALSAYWLGA